MLAAKRDELLAHGCRAHVEAWDHARIASLHALRCLIDAVKCIERVRREQIARDEAIALAGATLIAILRVISLAWSAAPTLLELDRDYYKPVPSSPLEVDDTEIRYSLLEIDPER